MRNFKAVAALAALPLTLTCAQAAHAAPGDPVKIGAGLTLDPILEGRLRYEHVDTPTLDASAVTMRLRGGFELKDKSGLSFLAEGEGTLALVDDFNAFPFSVAPLAVDSRQRRTGFAVVPDGENIELNRLQIGWKGKAGSITVGRQRINHEDQRFLGSVSWRQNEQTFDAVRAEAKLGPIALDATYANAQRTIFGIDAKVRQSLGGEFYFLTAGAKVSKLNLKGFAYLLSYDEAFYYGNSSQTYGIRATTSLPLSKAVKLNLLGSYARQSRYGTNPVAYSADYVAAEAGLAFKALTVTGGYELLSGDGKAGRSFQTPLATLHKFNGWADLFLTTPQTATFGGLQDWYAGAAYRFDKVKALPGLNAGVTYHRFSSDYGNLRYGDEWNAILGFKVQRLNLLAKYAAYNADRFGADKKVLWLQAEFAY